MRLAEQPDFFAICRNRWRCVLIFGLSHRPNEQSDSASRIDHVGSWPRARTDDGLGTHEQVDEADHVARGGSDGVRDGVATNRRAA